MAEVVVVVDVGIEATVIVVVEGVVKAEEVAADAGTDEELLEEIALSELGLALELGKKAAHERTGDTNFKKGAGDAP